jgi:aminocarboxymuconate-semialdehyde decarboxylase
MGAMLPFFSRRAEMVYRITRRNSPRDISGYWASIYGDTSMSGGTTEAYQLGYTFFGPDRLMYGSDYPFGPDEGEFQLRGNLVGIKSIKAPAADMEKILGGNARALLKIR